MWSKDWTELRVGVVQPNKNSKNPFRSTLVFNNIMIVLIVKVDLNLGLSDDEALNYPQMSVTLYP